MFGAHHFTLVVAGSPRETGTKSAGVLNEANTPDLRCVSGFLSVIDDASGSFGHAVGTPDTFSSQAVQNTFHLWMSLDSEGSDGIGITIRPVVDSASSSHPVNLSMLIESVPKDNVIACLRCVHAVEHNDSYTGDETGLPGLTVYAIGESVVVVGHSSKLFCQFFISGSKALRFGQTDAFTSGSTSQTSRCAGSFTSTNGVAGTWTVYAYSRSACTLTSVTGTSSGLSYAEFACDGTGICGTVKDGLHKSSFNQFIRRNSLIYMERSS